MVSGVRRLCVYRCKTDGCGNILFTSYDWFGRKRHNKLCKDCGGDFEKIGDNHYPDDYPNVRFQVKGKTDWGDDFILAFFKVTCPGCGEVVWLPWIRGKIDSDACQTCMKRKDEEESKVAKAFEEQDRIRDNWD